MGGLYLLPLTSSGLRTACPDASESLRTVRRLPRSDAPRPLSRKDDRGHWPAIWTWTLRGSEEGGKTWIFSRALSVVIVSTRLVLRPSTAVAVRNAEAT
jgi:hypothetical protein